MKTILSLFLVLLFVVGCGGGSEEGVMKKMEEMAEEEPEQVPDPDPPEQVPDPDPPEQVPDPDPIGRTSCASPALTVNSSRVSFFRSGESLCGLDSDGTLAVVVCTDGSTEIGVMGNVASRTRAIIDTAWADLNDNDEVDIEEIILSSRAFPISGNLNLENNRETMSITSLRLGDNFWTIFFRGDCVEGLGNSAAKLNTEAQDSDEDALEILNEATENLFELLAE